MGLAVRTHTLNYQNDGSILVGSTISPSHPQKITNYDGSNFGARTIDTTPPPEKEDTDDGVTLLPES